MAVPRCDCLLVTATALLLLLAGASAQSSSNCTAAANTLTPCITYVAGTDATPSLLCCTAVTVLNSDNPDCLCQVVAELNDTPTVNITKTYALPSACGVSFNTATCAALSPATAPATAPSTAPATAPSTAPTPALAPTPPGLSSPPPPPGNVTTPSPPGNAAPVTRPSAALTALAALAVSVFFSGFWVRALTDL